jgi:hypothetical protein
MPQKAEAAVHGFPWPISGAVVQGASLFGKESAKKAKEIAVWEDTPR